MSAIATSGLMQCSRPQLFDHLVGALLEKRGHVEAERLGGLEFAARKPVNAPRSMAVREFLRSNWHVVTIAVTAGAIVCAAVFLLSTMPPRSIAMARQTDAITRSNVP